MKRDWNSRTAILLIGLILVALNLVGLNLFGRLDLTDDSVYSLSEASIDLVENLEDPVTITAFFTDNLPAPYGSNRRFLKDKLDDYRAYGGNNVQYTFVDPANDESLQEEANRFRIPPVQIQVVESDNIQLKNAYMGVAIQYGGEREVIPVVQDLSSLEYDISGAIRQLTRDQLPSVGFLQGNGEPAPQQTMPTLYQELSRNYDIQTVTVNDSLPQLSVNTDALLVIAPTDTLSSNTLAALDQYIMGGGRVGFMLNKIAANLQQGQASEAPIGLDPLLRNYGMGLLPNLIMDEQSSAITVQRQQGFFNIAQQIEYPFLPIATRFDDENIMVNRLNNVMFFFASTVDTTRALPEGVERDLIIYSSSRSQTQQGFFMIQPGMPGQSDLTGGPFPLAATYTGVFPSMSTPTASSTPTRLALFGDGDFLNETVVGGAIPGNVELGLNLVDWLVQDDAMLSIRSKKIAPRVLRETPEAARPWIKYANMFGPTLAVVLFGVIRWRSRRKRNIVVVNNQS